MGSYNDGEVQTLAIGRADFFDFAGGAPDISRYNEDNTWSYDNGIVSSTKRDSSYEQRIFVVGDSSGGGSRSSTKYGEYSVDPWTSQLGYGSTAGDGGYYSGSQELVVHYINLIHFLIE